MRRTLSGLIALILIGGILAGCVKPSPAPAPADSSAPAPADSSAPAPADSSAPAPADSSAPAPAPVPLLAGPCVPGATAAILPSSPYGTGVTLKPPQPAGTRERPWFGYLSASQMDEPTAFSSGGTLGAVTMRKGGTATVDAAEFMLNGFLMPAPTLAWFETHLAFEGIQPSDHQYNTAGDYGNFDLRIPAGKDGDAFRLTIKEVLLDDGSSGDVTVTFCRQTPPKAAVTYKAKDGWHPVNAGVPSDSLVPADAPLTVRIGFTHDMLTDSVERSLKGPHDKTGQSQGDWITGLKWLDARTVELTADRPEPSMRLNVAGAQDKYGLFVPGGLPNLYSGESPQVLAVDPVSGQRTRLADLPPEPNSAALSPDGQLLRLVSRQMRGGRDVPDAQTLLVNLATGEAQPIKPDDPGWAPPGAILSIRREGESAITLIRQSTTGRQATVIPDLPPIDSFFGSPDGKWVAVLARSGVPSADDHVTVQFLIVSTSDGKNRKVLTGEATMYHPGKDGITLYGPAWSPDSTRIAFTQPNQEGASLVLADIAAGALRTLAANLPGVRSSRDPVTWSPDGSKILVGPLLLDAATGQVVQRIESIQGKPFWSNDGQWLLFQPYEWTEIRAYDLRTGKSTSLGQGMALGWSPEGKAVLIRWPNAQYRIRWGY